MPALDAKTLAPWALAALAAIAAPWALSESAISIAILTLLFVYLSISWNLVGGVAGQFSLGHSLFTAIGAYTAAMLYIRYGVSPWIGMIAGGLIAAAVGAFMAWLSFRYTLPPLSFALVTLALAMLGLLLFSSIDAFGAGAGLAIKPRGGPAQFQFRSETAYYSVIAIFVGAALVLSAWLYSTRIGLYFRTIRDNERAALAIGVNVLRYKILAMAISAFLTALGGTFYAQYLLYVDPKTIAGLHILVETILFVVVGGMGTIWGPVLGPVLLVPLGEWLRNSFGAMLPGMHALIYGVLLVVIVRFMPEGIVGMARRLRDRWRFRDTT